MLHAAMPGEIEDRLLAEARRIHVARHHEHLVAFGHRFGDDLAVGIDDQAATDQVMTVLDAGLRDRDDPTRVVMAPACAESRLWNRRCCSPSADFNEFTDGVL